jgi:hypothetical protein
MGTGPYIQENLDNKSYVIGIFKSNSLLENIAENLGKLGKDINKQRHINSCTFSYAFPFIMMK